MAQVILKHPIVKLLQAQTAGGPYLSHLSTLCSLFPPHLISQIILCTCDIIVVINLCFPVPTDILRMVLWCFFPIFSVFSNPSWSRRMATLPESGSARGFFLLKESRFSPQSPQACSERGIGLKRSFGAICWFPQLGNYF